MRILIRVVINAVALWVAAALLDGIDLGEDGNVGRTVLAALVVGAIFGLVNAIVKPILTILSLPFIVVTLGLFLIIINALMLWFTSWLSEQLDLAFRVEDFWWNAIWGALIVSVVSWALSLFLGDDD